MKFTSAALCAVSTARAEIATSKAQIAPPSPNVMRTEANSPIVKEVRLETQFVVCGGGLNILRLRKVAFDPVDADALRLVVTEAWGGGKAHVFALDAR